jgi:PEGA domain
MGALAALLSLSLSLSLASSPTTPDPSAAEPPRVAVLELAVSGPLPPQWEQALATALRDGLARGRFRVVEPQPAAPGCTELSCLSQAARGAVAYAVTAHVGVADRMYTIEVALVDANSGESLASANGNCEVCGLADVSERVADLAATMRDKLDRLVTAPPMLWVSTNPEGAEIRLDGEPKGASPVEFEAAQGPHRLEVRRRGYVDSIRDLELMSGVRERVQIVLEPVAAISSPSSPPPDGADPRTRRRTILGAVLLGGGLAAGAAGATLWALDSRPVRSRCSGDDRDALGECRYLHDTIGAGIGLVATGATAAISGAIVLAVRKAVRARRSAARR